MFTLKDLRQAASRHNRIVKNQRMVPTSRVKKAALLARMRTVGAQLPAPTMRRSAPRKRKGAKTRVGMKKKAKGLKKVAKKLTF